MSDLQAIVNALKTTVGDNQSGLVQKVKDLQESTADAARIKQSYAGLNGEVNGLKGEVTAASIGLKGVESNFRLYSKDFNLNEILEQAKLDRGGMLPHQLKQSVTDLETKVRKLRQDLTAEQDARAQAVRRIDTKLNTVERTADEAHGMAKRALRKQRSGAAAADPGGRGRRGERQVNVSNIDQAQRAIQKLEDRITNLARALG